MIEIGLIDYFVFVVKKIKRGIGRGQLVIFTFGVSHIYGILYLSFKKFK